MTQRSTTKQKNRIKRKLLARMVANNKRLYSVLAQLLEPTSDEAARKALNEKAEKSMRAMVEDSAGCLQLSDKRERGALAAALTEGASGLFSEQEVAEMRASGVPEALLPPICPGNELAVIHEQLLAHFEGK